MRKKHPNPNIQKDDDKAKRRRDQFESMRQSPASSGENESDKKSAPKKDKSNADRSDADDAEPST